MREESKQTQVQPGLQPESSRSPLQPEEGQREEGKLREGKLGEGKLGEGQLGDGTG